MLHAGGLSSWTRQFTGEGCAAAGIASSAGGASLLLALAARVLLGALALTGGGALLALALLALQAPLLALGRLRARGLALLRLALLALLGQALLP